jgi:hypothetical protein
LNDDEVDEMRGMIAAVEDMVLTDKQVEFGYTLYDVEMAIESNPDYYAYFERDGIKITKFDVERELNRIRTWIFMKVRERSVGRRFKRFR